MLWASSNLSDTTVFIKQIALIARLPENFARANFITHQNITALAGEFLLGIVQNRTLTITSFGGKPHDYRF